MRPCAALVRGLPGAIWILAALLAADAHAGTEQTEETDEPIEIEFSGSVAVEGRWFPQDGAFAGQRSLATGFVAEPRLYLEDVAGRSFTFAPFFRYDHSDPRRTHFELQEAYLLLLGEVGDSGWELRVGADQVFWGVTESQHLVDIVNQVDFVEHPNGEAKLGQPMVHATWFGDWGAFEVFGMPHHRARTFQGREGRLRLPFVVNDERIQYESSAGPWHLDLASRYSHSFGPLDLGLSALGVALLRRRPRELRRASRQELLDASKAWWGGWRGRLADRRRRPFSVSLGVIPLVFARFVEVPVRVESRRWPVAPAASGPPRLPPGASGRRSTPSGRGPGTGTPLR